MSGTSYRIRLQREVWKLKSGKLKSDSNYICTEAKGILTKSLPAVHGQTLTRACENVGLVHAPTSISRHGTA